MKKVLIIIIVILILLISSFFIYRPGRVIFPELVGFHKISKNFYIDDISKTNEAKVLLYQSIVEIEKLLFTFDKKPKVIFCSCQQNFEKFGFKKSASRTVGIYGIVIGPRGWTSYIVKHELIHHFQAEKLGSIRMNFFPQWFIEGMAYSLSEDPRIPLDEPWETYRKKFTEWYESINKDELINEMKLIQ